MLDKFVHLKKCPVCASSSLVPHKSGNMDVSTLNKDHIKITDSDYGKIWNLSRCNNCSHVFANPCPSQEFIQSLYGIIEDPLYQEEARGRAKNFKRILTTLGRIQPKKGILLDVGAATGILLDIAREQGWKVEGVEPSAWAVGIARERYDLSIMEGAFEAAPLSEERYTAVTMVDFIEHIPHPIEAVTIARKILLPDGILCLVTPDINSMAAKIMGQKWWHYRPGHLGYFTKKSLLFLLQGQGFRIIKMRRYNWTFSLHYLLSRIPSLKFLIKSPVLASSWRRIPIKLVLRDSYEIYATKNK